MTKKRSTKSSLLLSLLALLLCCAMLVGTTFAWFTDSVTSSGNIIQTGTLDIALMWAEGAEDPANAAWKDASEGAIFNSVLWEPGYTEAKHMDIINKGSLALKYQLRIEPTGEVSKLADVIDVYFIEGATALKRIELDKYTPVGTLANVIDDGIAYGSLTADTNRDFTIVLKMRESAGNEYQNLAIGSAFAIKLIATQYTFEEDSFGPEYDGGAMWLGDVDLSWYDPAATELTLNDPEDLAGFAAIVNGTAVAPTTTFAGESTATALHDNFAGKTVKLASDLNLNNISWTPIGRIGASSTDFTYAFKGTFDGQGHTVSNLKVTNDGWAGLFGIAYKADIKNVTVDGVQLNSSRMTGAVVGQLYGSLDNCHVKNATITVVPNAVSGGYDNGDKVGGIVGWIGDNGNNRTLTNCSADEVTVRGYRDVGAIAGYVAWSTTLENNKATNSTLIGDQSVNFYGHKDYNVGAIWGRNSVSGTGAGVNDVNNTSENVTIETVNVIADVDDLKNVLTNGGEYALAVDLTLDADETILVPAGVEATLNLNGKTIATTSGATGANYNAIDVHGTLTVSNGTITTKHTGTNMGWNNSTNVFNVTAGGVLNIVDAAVENLGGSDMAFGVHLNNWGEVTLNVENSTIKSTYTSVRVFNSGPDVNNVTIKNSTIESAGTKAFWVHNYTSVDFGGKLYSAAKDAYDEAKVAARLNFDIFGNGNTYISANPARVVEYGFTGAINVDPYANGNTLVGVGTLAELQAALDDAVDKTTILLTADIVGNVTVTQKVGVNLTIDGNGHQYNGTIAINGGSRNSAETLTIKRINFVASTAIAASIDAYLGDDNTRYAHNVTVDGCTFTMTGTAKYVTPAVDLYQPYNFTMKNCTVTGAHSVLQSKGGHNGITVDNVTAKDCKNGFGMGTMDGKITVSNCNMELIGYGIRFDACVASAGVTIENCNIKANIPVVVRKATGTYDLTFNGTNTMTATNNEGLWMAIGIEEYGDVDKAGLTAASGKITVTLNDTGLDASGVYGAN